MSRTLTIQTDDSLDEALEARARSDGKSVPEMAREILDRVLLGRSRAGSRRRLRQKGYSAQTSPSLKSREREHRWRHANRAFLQKQFAEQWVVLEEDQIVAHGKSMVSAVEEARTKGIEAPYVFFVQPPRPTGTVRIGL